MTEVDIKTRLIGVRGLLEHYKYLIVIVLSIIFLGFVDENSIFRLYKYSLQVDDLKREIELYNARNEADTRTLQEIRKDTRTIERIARERYFMKADNEDIYVIEGDKTTRNNETIK